MAEDFPRAQWVWGGLLVFFFGGGGIRKFDLRASRVHAN